MKDNELIIKLDKNAKVIGIKGKCKAKDFSKQIETLKGLRGQK